MGSGYSKMWLEAGLYLLIAGAVGAGVLGAVVRSWSISTSLYSLNDRVALVEGILQREVKVRAGQARQSKQTPEELQVLAALANPPQPKEKKTPWWENPSLKKGSYAP